eukprot:s1471_g9.t1
MDERLTEQVRGREHSGEMAIWRAKCCYFSLGYFSLSSFLSSADFFEVRVRDYLQQEILPDLGEVAVLSDKLPKELVYLDLAPKDAAEMLLCSERWANGFLQVKQKHRFSLWKLNATKENEPSPVSLASLLIQHGVKVDDLIPEAALESGLDFVQEGYGWGDARSEFDKSALGTAFREAKAAKAQAAPKSPPLPEGTSAEDAAQLWWSAKWIFPSGERSAQDLGELTANNQAQAATIEAAAEKSGESAEKRRGVEHGELGEVREIVDTLLEVFEEAVEVTGKHLEPLLTGYTGEANIASSARARLQELKYRQANLQAQLVVMGPCQVGKTSLTYALAGFAALPPAMPSMVMTKWVPPVP